MVLAIRQLFDSCQQLCSVFVRTRTFPRPYAYSRDFGGKAMLQDLFNDLNIPVHGVRKRDGNLGTYLATRRLHVTHPGIIVWTKTWLSGLQ